MGLELELELKSDLKSNNLENIKKFHLKKKIQSLGAFSGSF
jgi:hypothetical protein